MDGFLKSIFNFLKQFGKAAIAGNALSAGASQIAQAQDSHPIIDPIEHSSNENPSVQVSESQVQAQKDSAQKIHSIDVSDMIDALSVAAQADLDHGSKSKVTIIEVEKKEESEPLKPSLPKEVDSKPLPKDPKVEEKKDPKKETPSKLLPGEKPVEVEIASSVPKGDLKLNILQATCRKYVGTVEQGGPNKGKMVEEFQKAVDGKAQGEAWCCSFVWYCLIETEAALKQEHSVDTMSWLYKTEHVLTMWNKSPKESRSKEPRQGYLIVWQHYDDKGKPTSHGHVGIIVEVLDKEFLKSVEGNTRSPVKSKVEREGDGVYLVKRSYKANTGSMRVVGFLKPWRE